MPSRRPRLTVRRLMIAVAVLGVLFLAADRSIRAIHLAGFHAEREAYFGGRLDWALATTREHADDRRLAHHLAYFREEVVYHAFWKRAFLLAAWRPWDRLPVDAQEYPPRRSRGPAVGFVPAS